MMNTPQKILRVALIQSDIIPDRVEDNLTSYRNKLQNLTGEVNLIIFPELFNCGFSPLFGECAEPMNGTSIRFLQEVSLKFNADVVASLPVREDKAVVNRLVWVTQEGIKGQYDKRHLFFGGEQQVCLPGQHRIIIERFGWKILPLICFDIRFPVWCRNACTNKQFDYDVLLLIANFPEQRIEVLRTLAKARAIENQAYVLVVNRFGKDGNENSHNGNSMVVSPLGKVMAQAPANEFAILKAELNMSFLHRIRNKFLVGELWDPFSILK